MVRSAPAGDKIQVLGQAGCPWRSPPLQRRAGTEKAMVTCRQLPSVNAPPPLTLVPLDIAGLAEGSEAGG